jgi:hypothetical protein
MKRYWLPVLLLVILLTAGCKGEPELLAPTNTLVPEPLPGALFVNAQAEVGPISPYVYGANHGPWAAVPFDLFGAAETSGITHLRFPGGNYGDRNSLRSYQIDQFMDLAQMMGAEVSISARLLDGTPEEAAKLVRYVNIEKNYNVRHWSIGNEFNLFSVSHGIEYTSEQHNRDWRAMAEAMLAVDPDLVLIGPDISQYPTQLTGSPTDSAGKDWMSEFLQQNGDLVDIVSIHRYPFPTQMSGSATTIDQLRAQPPEWEDILAALRAEIREITGKDLPIAVTEVNSHWSKAYGGEASPDSFFNAIWWADVLGRLIANRVAIVDYFSLQSPAPIGAYGLLARTEVRPTYYTYQMYRHFGDILLESHSEDALTTIYAARRSSDNALTLMVINLSDQVVSKPLQLAGWEAASAELWRFDPEHQAENLGQVDLEGTLTVPPTSINLYIIPSP